MKQKKKEPVQKQSEAKPEKSSESLVNIKYDPQRKSWIGPVTGSTNTMNVTKAMTHREEKLRSQDKDRLQHNRRKVQRTVTPDLEVDDYMEGNEDFLQSADIDQPFPDSQQEARGAKWGAAALPAQTADRAGGLSFEKPVKKDSTSSHFLSPTQQVYRLEQDLARKEREISMLRIQLEKAHRDNNTLVEKLQGYSGKQYQDMEKDNAQLREAYRRESRKAIRLDGECKRNSNTRIQKMNHEKELEEKHAPDWQKKPAKNYSQDDQPAMVIEIRHNSDDNRQN